MSNYCIAAQKWLKHEESRSSAAFDVLNSIRLARLTPRFLLDVVETEPLFINEKCRKILNQAKVSIFFILSKTYLYTPPTFFACSLSKFMQKKAGMQKRMQQRVGRCIYMHPFCKIKKICIKK